MHGFSEKTCRNCKHGQRKGVCAQKQARSCATRLALDKGVKNSETGIMLEITGDYWGSPTIRADEVQVGMGLRTWFGEHTVTSIYEYKGPFDFIKNILHFSNGMEMSNERQAIYDLCV